MGYGQQQMHGGNYLMQNENFVTYYQQMMGNNNYQMQQNQKSNKHKKNHCANQESGGDPFYHSLSHFMINELVGTEICKGSLSNTTDNSTGDHSQNSSFDEDNDKMLTSENLQSFITDSPFSFRNPIFFSVPRD